METYNNQSTGIISAKYCGGKPAAISTMIIVTRPAWGIPAAPTLARTDVKLSIGKIVNFLKLRKNICHEFSYLTKITWPMLKSIPRHWAIYIAATASYSAVPFMFTVAPNGTTNFVTLVSILLFSSKHFKVRGNVALL